VGLKYPMVDLKKKVVRIVQKLYEICARNITQKKKKKNDKKMHVVSLQLVPPLLSSNTMAYFWIHEAFLSVP
jgi:hypothetical protein